MSLRGKNVVSFSANWNNFSYLSIDDCSDAMHILSSRDLAFRILDFFYFYIFTFYRNWPRINWMARIQHIFRV